MLMNAFQSFFFSRNLEIVGMDWHPFELHDDRCEDCSYLVKNK